MTQTSDFRNPAADVQWRHVGTGHASTFRCAACCKPRLITGRKLLRVQGVMQYVCAACNQERTK